jgi:hypothetical protein
MAIWIISERRNWQSAAPGSVEPGAWVRNVAPHVIRLRR